MAQEYLEIVFRIVAALLAGGLIGLERSHRGRPAGFRTHALVCLASSLLMLVTVYESHWFPRDPSARVIIDPTRMAQGIMTGIGFYFAAGIGTVLVLGTLSTFRWIEARLPTETYAIFMVRYARDNAITEGALHQLVQSTGFSLHNLSYRLHGDVGQLEYRMVLRTMDAGNARALSDKLRADPAVLDYRIAPTGD